MQMRRSNALGAALLLLATLTACGGGGGPTPIPTPTPVPAATVQATGRGALVVHPSIDPARLVAVETPLTVTETAGGTADWNFARMSLFMGNTEIERGEIGSDILARAGFGRIQPRSNISPVLVFRFNAEDFDRVTLTLGFGDISNGRQFTADVPFSTFTDVTISFTPLFAPPGGMVHSGAP
jgi:hypothetical protein